MIETSGRVSADVQAIMLENDLHDISCVAILPAPFAIASSELACSPGPMFHISSGVCVSLK